MSGVFEDLHNPRLRDLVGTAEPLVADPAQITLDDLVIATRYEVEIEHDAMDENPTATVTASDVMTMRHANRNRGCSQCGHDQAAHLTICIPRTARTKRRTRFNSKRGSVR